MPHTPNYIRMYFRMFNDISTAIEQLESGDPWKARITLIESQRTAEDCYVRALCLRHARLNRKTYSISRRR